MAGTNRRAVYEGVVEFVSVKASKSNRLQNSLYAERTDRFELRNFDADVAKQFAFRVAASRGLVANNIDTFLEHILEYSQGNPAAICRMVEMAMQSTYRSGESIKTAPLYIDFRMSWATGARRERATSQVG